MSYNYCCFIETEFLLKWKLSRIYEENLKNLMKIEYTKLTL